MAQIQMQKLKITQEKPWARLTPRPTGRDLVTLIQNLRTDADHGLLGNLPRLYSTIGSDSSRDIAAARYRPPAVFPSATTNDDRFKTGD